MAGRGSLQGRAQSADLAVAGWLPLSMLDWEGRLATTIFVAGCNLSCPFCHNPELVAAAKHPATIPIETIDEHIASKSGWLDGVVISGGEPSVHPQLRQLIIHLRTLGAQIKLDTNGTRPDVLSQLLDDGLLGYVAMDVKTSFDRYGEVARRPVSTEAIGRSIDLIVGSGIDHEFRTTMVPGYVDREDALWVARRVSRGRRYALQQFNPKAVLDPDASKIKPYEAEYMRATQEACDDIIPTLLRGVK